MAGKTLGSLLVRLGLSTKEADASIKKFEKSLRDAGKRMESIGNKLSIGYTAPFLLALRQSVKEYDEGAKAQRKLELAIGGVNKNLLAQADALAKNTIHENDAIINQQAYLAVLGLNEDQIAATTAAAVDLSAALGIGLDEATKSLAKTFTGAHGSLGKLIPGFKDLTKEQLKNGEAITMIGKMYKGFAEDEATQGANSIVMMQKAFSDVAETIGSIAMPAINDITGSVKGLAEDFQKLDPSVQSAIVKFAALGAAAGPVLTLATNVSKVVKEVGLLNMTKFAAVIGAGQLAKSLVGEEKMAEEEAKLLEMAKKAYGTGGTKGQQMGVQAKAAGMAGFNLIGGDVTGAERLLKIGRGEDLPQDGVATMSWKFKAAAEVTAKSIGGVTNAFQDLNSEVAKSKIPEEGFRVEMEDYLHRFSTPDDRPEFWDGVPSLGIGTPRSGGRGIEHDLAKVSVFGDDDPFEQMRNIAPNLEGQNKEIDKSKAAWGALGTVITDTMSTMGQALASGEASFESFAKAALLSAAKVAKAAMVETLMGMIKDGALKGGIPGAVIGLAAGIGIISMIESQLGNIKAPALAKGAMTTGPTMALIGDNPSGKEAILPFERNAEFAGMIAKHLGGSGGGTLTAKIGLDALEFALIRQTQNSSRMSRPTVSNF